MKLQPISCGEASKNYTQENHLKFRLKNDPTTNARGRKEMENPAFFWLPNYCSTVQSNERPTATSNWSAGRMLADPEREHSWVVGGGGPTALVGVWGTGYVYVDRDGGL